MDRNILKERYEETESAVPELSATYSAMAEHYDYMLKHVDYEHWYNYIRAIMFVYCGVPERVLEVGTGTGRFGALFSKDNFEMYGVDLSLDMLRVAKLRAFNNYRIFCGDARNFRVSKPFPFIFCVHDTLNYLISLDDVEKAICNMRDALSDDGVLLFDLTTEYNVLANFDSQTQHYTRGDCKISWSNEYDDQTRIITSHMQFQYQLVPEVLTKKEVHSQRIYDESEIVPIIERSGLELIHIYSDYSFEVPHEKTIMTNYIVRKR